jgi:hypothetical protein
MTQNAKCPDAKCLPTLEKVAKEMPYCVADGTNLRATFEKSLKDCKVSSAASRTFSTSAGVALSSAALALAMVYL